MGKMNPDKVLPPSIISHHTGAQTYSKVYPWSSSSYFVLWKSRWMKTVCNIWIIDYRFKYLIIKNRINMWYSYRLFDKGRIFNSLTNSLLLCFHAKKRYDIMIYNNLFDFLYQYLLNGFMIKRNRNINI